MGYRTFLVIVCILVAGCGGPETKTPPAEEVVFWHAMGDELGKVLDEIVRRFNEGREGPKLVHRYQGYYPNLRQKISLALKAGNAPDLAQQYEAWTAYYNADKGKELVLPLDAYIEKSPDFDLEDFFPVFIEDNTWDGKIWSLPCTKSLPVLYYNKELFEKAGLDPEKPPRTWPEFAEVARKLTRDSNGDGQPDQYGWSFVVDPWIFGCMVLQQGAPLAQGDEDILPFDRTEYIKAVQYHVDAVRGEEPFAIQTTGLEFQNDFVSQNAAMIVTTSVSKFFMVDRIRFNFGMAPLPYWDEPVSIMAGTNIGIFRSSPPEKRQVAWEFIEFFTSPEITAFWARNTGYVPVRRSALELPEFKSHLERDPTPMAAISQIENASFEPRSAAWYEVRDQLTRAIEKILAGEGSMEENLKAVSSRMEQSREL